MDYMFDACSTTARRGALDWAPVFEKANLPIFEQLYESVRNGTETRKSLEFNGRSTYREDLARESEIINNQEIWRAGMCLRSPIVVLALTGCVFELQARPSARYAPTTNRNPSRRVGSEKSTDSTTLLTSLDICIIYQSTFSFTRTLL